KRRAAGLIVTSWTELFLPRPLRPPSSAVSDWESPSPPALVIAQEIVPVSPAPGFVWMSGASVRRAAGCLSAPGHSALRPRWREIWVAGYCSARTAVDLDGGALAVEPLAFLTFLSFDHGRSIVASHPIAVLDRLGSHW